MYTVVQNMKIKLLTVNNSKSILFFFEACKAVKMSGFMSIKNEQLMCLWNTDQCIWQNKGPMFKDQDDNVKRFGTDGKVSLLVMDYAHVQYHSFTPLIKFKSNLVMTKSFCQK